MSCALLGLVIHFSLSLPHCALGTGGVDVCGDINLTVTVEHTGPTADITVQVYMQFVNASVPVPRCGGKRLF
jgi:hypothetical protein